MLAGGPVALAGAAAAWFLRGRGSGPRRIEGTVVGASHERGHLLRGERIPEPTETRRVAVAILGGGVAGLSAAWKFSKAGFGDFEVLELEDAPGGNSRWGENAVSAYPWGAHYVPTPTRESRAVLELLEDLGVAERGPPGSQPSFDERSLCHEPQERLYIHGRWQGGENALFPRSGMPPEEAKLAGAFRERLAAWRAWRDAAGRRAFAIPMELGSDASEVRELDRLSMAEWLVREGLDSPRIRWFVDYSCRDDYGTSIERTSAWAGLHYFAARDPEDPEILTWPEGNGWIVRRLAGIAGPRIRTGAVVRRVRPSEQGVAAIYLDVASGRTVRLEADRAIYALPRFTAPRVVEGYDRAGTGEFTYAPWMVANLTVRRLPAGAAWDNVLFQSQSLGYVVATHQSLATLPGPSVLTYYRPFPELEPADARRLLMERTWDQWVDEILGDLARAHPNIEEQVTRIDVLLWGHAMIRPTVGFVTGTARRAALEPMGRLFFAHSDMSGLSLFEEAQYRGVKAAEGILASLGVAFESSL